MLQQLIDAGLGSMPGGGAEILVEDVRRKICPEKISGQRWLEIIRTAHKTGLKTNATMLYGHVETVHDRLQPLQMLRVCRTRPEASRPLSRWPSSRKTRTSNWARGARPDWTT